MVYAISLWSYGNTSGMYVLRVPNYMYILKKEKNGLPHIPFSTFIIHHISFELE